jgi:hypothetical protein
MIFFKTQTGSCNFSQTLVVGSCDLKINVFTRFEPINVSDSRQQEMKTKRVFGFAKTG